MRTKATKRMTAAVITPIEFDPDAFIIRTCAADGLSYGDFKWPLAVGEIVTCPDWEPTAECGNGLHGLLDGIGDWSLIDGDIGRVWQVIGVRRDEVVTIDDSKVKFPRGKIAYSGSAAGAMAFMQPHLVAAILLAAKDNIATGYRGHAAATGYMGHAAATGDMGHAAATGYRGHATATGDSGHAAATGDRGHAAATGDRGHAAATGDMGHAAATGDMGHAAATGKNAIAASLGINGTAKASSGWIVLAAYDDKFDLITVRASKIGGDQGLKPDTAYRLTVAGEFEEVVCPMARA